MFLSLSLCQHTLALPRDPNNAALLYYQAFLMRPEPDIAARALIYDASFENVGQFLRTGEFRPLSELRRLETELQKAGALDANGNPKETVRKLDDFIGRVEVPHIFALDDDRELAFKVYEYEELRKSFECLNGIDLKEEIQEYLEEARPAINIMHAASKLALCDWGHQFSKGVAGRISWLLEARLVSNILAVDALLLSTDGMIRAALERCLQMRRFATHIGDEYSITHGMAVSADKRVIELIGYLLRDIQTDPKKLIGLRRQLALQSPSSLSLSKAIRLESRHILQSIRRDENVIGRALEMQSMIICKDPNDTVLTEDELLARAAKPFLQYMNTVIRIINDKETAYEESQVALEELAESFERKHGSPLREETLLPSPEDVLRYCIYMLTPDNFQGMHTMQVSHTAYYNRLLAAIELALVHCQTGQWPEHLPEGLPKDPFTGKDFVYSRTEDGFSLTYDSQDITRSRKRQYVFP